MPIFKYKCTSCEHVFEKLQNINSDPLTKCPDCGNLVIKMMPKRIGIVYKCNGFYSVDSKED